jgi:hypothetical protein
MMRSSARLKFRVEPPGFPNIADPLFLISNFFPICRRMAPGQSRSESTDSISSPASFDTATGGHGEEQDTLGSQKCDDLAGSVPIVTSQLSEFRFCPELPKAHRLRIWRHAVSVPRVVGIHEEHNSYFKTHLSSSKAICLPHLKTLQNKNGSLLAYYKNGQDTVLLAQRFYRAYMDLYLLGWTLLVL